MSAPAPLTNDPATLLAEGWTVRVVPETASTNFAASRLPAWHALRARVQTGGRGRIPERRWVSDEGGLWLSAVVPCPGAARKWEILPLATGWALLGALREFGVPDLRLRWPNDLLVGRRKLAGVLVERFRPDTAVIGVGLNISNRPELAEPALAGATARLADLVPGGHDPDDLARIVLRALRRMHTIVLDRGFGVIADALNLGWQGSRRVELTLTGRAATFAGSFQGIDAQGRLRLVTERDGPQTFDASQVARLRELE